MLCGQLTPVVLGARGKNKMKLHAVAKLRKYTVKKFSALARSHGHDIKRKLLPSDVLRLKLGIGRGV